MRRLVAVACFFAVLALATQQHFTLAAGVNTLQAILDGRLSALSSLGMGAAAVGAGGFRSEATAVAGALTDAKTFPFSLDGSLRADGFGEVLLAVAALKMTAVTGPQLDETIPAQFLPGGLAFTNPTHSKALTMRMLLTHTSSLLDTTRIASEMVTASGIATQDIISYGRAVFLSPVGGGASDIVSNDIWGTAEPGTPTAHKWAASNIALLTFILQKKIDSEPTLVKSSQRSVWAFIQEQIINTVGLTSTFVLMPDGAAPLTQQGIQKLRGAHRQDPAASNKVEASYLSGTYMVQTSMLDMARLMHALFLPTGSLTAQGSLMKTAPVTLPTLVGVRDTSRLGVAQQGLGVVLMDRAALCSSWEAHTTSKLSSPCPFATGATIPAFVSVIGASSTSAHFVGCTSGTTSNLLGTASPVTTTTAAPGTARVTVTGPDRCFAASVISSSTGAVSKDSASIALQALASEAVLQSTQTYLDIGGFAADIVTPSSQSRGVAWGFGVFGILVAILLGVLVWSYVTEIVVTQAPLSGDLGKAAYPYLDKLG